MLASANVNQDTQPLPAKQGEAAAVESTHSLPLCWGSKCSHSKTKREQPGQGRFIAMATQGVMVSASFMVGSITEIQADFKAVFGRAYCNKE